MAEVKLEIKVKDQDVKDAEASIKRLEAATERLRVLNKARVENPSPANIQASDLARRQVAELSEELNRNTKSMHAADQAASELASGGMAALDVSTLGVIGALGAAVVALVAFVAAIYETAKLVISVTKTTSEWAIELRNLAEETGLAAGTVAALRLEADAQGRSFTAVTGVMDAFRKKIGEAAAGSKEALADLRSLGIDGAKAIYNVDGAFRQAIAAIAAAKDPFTQIRLAMAAFDQDGEKLIPFIQEFHGNIAALEAKAQELGLSIGGKNVQAAQAFTRNYTEAKAAIDALYRTFGNEFLPTVTQGIKDFSNWLTTNKSTILDWAQSAGNGVSWALDKFERMAQWLREHPYLFQTPGIGGVAYQLVGVPGQAPVSGQPNYDPSLNHLNVPGVPDAAAVSAMIAEQQKQLEKAIEKNKADWDAAIDLWEAKGREAASVLDSVFKGLEKAVQTPDDLANFATETNKALTEFYSKEKAILDYLDSLETERARRNEATANQMALLQQKQLNRRREYGLKDAAIVQQAADKISAIQRQAAENDLAEMQANQRRAEQVRNEALRRNIALAEEAVAGGVRTAAGARDYIVDQQKDALGSRRRDLLDQLDEVDRKAKEFPKIAGELARKRADIQGEINLIAEQLQTLTTKGLIPKTEEERIKQHLDLLRSANEAVIAERRRVAQITEEDTLVSQLKALEDQLARGGVNDGIEIAVARAKDLVDYRRQELDAVIAINHAQFELDHAMEISNNKIRAGVLEHIASQTNLNKAIVDGINGTYDAMLAGADRQLDNLNQKFHGLLSFITEPLKAIEHNVLGKVFEGVIDKIFGTGASTQTDNPVAKPVVNKLEQIHTTLKEMQAAGGLTGGGGSINIGGLGSLTGGGGGGGVGPGGTAPFNPSSTTGGGSLGGGNDILAGIHDVLHGGGGTAGTASSSGGILGKIFGKGGVFGKQGFGNNQGTFDAIGAIAGVVGGAIGGRAGNIIGLAGSGLSIGFMFGGPIGAAIGAGIGALVGLFMGDPKKKQDKNENMPKLTQGFSDAMTQLQQILADIRSLNGDPDALLSKARDIRSQIASGFGVQFGSKWGQKESAQMIAQELASIDRQPDGIMAQIIAAAGIARGAADRSKRILPEFAGGYFADFFRPNGLIPGAFDGADNILAMISRGEAVLNPAQMARARAAAGFDVFAHAGIPNYPNASSGPRLAGGGIAGVGLGMQPQVVNVQVNMTGVPIDQHVETYLTSDQGVRAHLQVRKQLVKSNDVSNL